MAFGSGRLPNKYTLACHIDPAIDWFESAKLLGVDTGAEEFKAIKDEKQRRANIEAAAALKYQKFGATTTLPLVPKTGQKITEFVCRPLTKDEYADISGYMMNLHRLRLETVRCALVDVRNWLDEEPWKDADDLPQSVIEELGSAIYMMNRTTGVVRDF